MRCRSFPQVSRIASHFGLKGIDEDVAIRTTHKGERSSWQRGWHSYMNFID